MAKPFLSSPTDTTGCDLIWQFKETGPNGASDPWQGASQKRGCKAACSVAAPCADGSFCDFSTGTGTTGVCQACADCMAPNDQRADPCSECLMHLSSTDDVVGFLPTAMSAEGQAACSASCDAAQIETPLQYPLRIEDTYFTSYTITVYHPDSYLLDASWTEAGYSVGCVQGDPTCCEFSVRIMDLEDPALNYPPYGVDQYLERCQSVQECGDCEWEKAEPTISSDRVCMVVTQCDTQEDGTGCEYLVENSRTIFGDAVSRPGPQPAE
eukprot:SAG22_NODE_32_length_27675_cov_12.130119_5_plen_268_part_00